MNGKQWIDISQPLTNKIAVWPGDTPYSFHLALTKEETSSVNIGKLTMGVHTGTHIDAPFHFNQRGQKVDELDLDVYMGRARLLDMTGHDIIGKQEFINEDLDGVKRLLVRTRNEIDPEMFPHSFTVFDPNVGPFLKEKGVCLLGTDAPSVDAVNSKTLRAHHALYQNNVSILENVVLHHVEPGDYELIALPLAIHGADGSPVRAVIRPLHQ